MADKNAILSDNSQDDTSEYQYQDPSPGDRGVSSGSYQTVPEINFPDDRWITEIRFNNETGRNALYYAACNQYVDYEIFMWLLDYFGNWTHDDFKRLSVHIQKKIKDMLMDRGIFVDYIGRKKTIAKALDDLVQMTRMPEWPHEIAAARTFDSRLKMAKGQFP
ncbi:hypothetical protein TSTA_107460 [Talaromyces stipitatus ATCC 10500]|uniref:Uncharacterized protein n=1 Tax=Talaromyces stipitatus (strain ATCC 10500 / CBS 375.48 / QM 6759 / NRRL 1006) TaxID=441959 RepID=B8MN90_TALSN|nr:uncharacterized protein TSTA_107460 [Talaromyces stipitatus ATCC 10500]EED14539.1 hypothetical protein TSTA_107460 [Talaromyces stipitatus ATCC 10500]